MSQEMSQLISERLGLSSLEHLSCCCIQRQQRQRQCHRHRPSKSFNDCQAISEATKSSNVHQVNGSHKQTKTTTITRTTSNRPTMLRHLRPSRNMMLLVAMLLATISCQSAQNVVGMSSYLHSSQIGNVVNQREVSHLFSCGKSYYRTFYLDSHSNKLYVGAMDHIYRLDLANVNNTNCVDDAIRVNPSDPQKCISKGKSENFDCRNHVKVIQPMGKSAEHLYVCGTNAYSPRDAVLVKANMTLASDPTRGIGGPNALAECPFDPDDNSTAVWVERGNPFEAPALYTGTAADFSKTDPVIFRTELYNQSNGQKIADAKRTTKHDSKSLDKPNFVGSFEIGEYVYFFFRESAVEFINCGKSIYSRVARVCKRDNGYKPAMFGGAWTTYLKARLNCSIPGEFPFHFDEIQSIYRNPYDQKKFHAVFSTSGNGLTGSAICTFSLDAIQEAFQGKFKEQKDSTAAWLPVPSFKLNQSDPRAGACVDDTQALSDRLVTFVRGHPLMDSAVANDNGRPAFYRRDLMFTKIVVDVVEVDGVRYTIYFAGTSTGHVYKVVEWQDPLAASGPGGQQESTGSQSTLVEVIEATVPEPVRAMEISSRHKSLYVASDSLVRQVNLAACKQRHDSCLQCIRDPYCGWDRKHLDCRHLSPIDAQNLIQDVANVNPDICQSVIKHKDVHVTWGQTVHLPCKLAGFIQESQDLQQLMASQHRHRLQHQSLGPDSAPIDPSSASQLSTSNGWQQNNGHLTHLHPTNYIQWFYHRRDTMLSPGYPVLQRRDKFILAADQGLVIMNANEPGWYQCRLGNQIIHSYNLIIDTKTCAAPDEAGFKRVYADWCREIERYKVAARNWQSRQNRCQAIGANQQQIAQQQQQLQQQQQQQQSMQTMRHLPGDGYQDVWTSAGR